MVERRIPHLIQEVSGAPKLKATTMTLQQIYNLTVIDERNDRLIANMERDKGLTMTQRWDRSDREEMEQRDAEIGWQGRDIKP